MLLTAAWQAYHWCAAVIRPAGAGVWEVLSYEGRSFCIEKKDVVKQLQGVVIT